MSGLSSLGPELKMGVASLFAHKLRSLLTMLGMIFGVGISGAVFTTMLDRGTSAALFSGVRIGLTISALACFAGVAACSTPDLPPRGRQQTAGK